MLTLSQRAERVRREGVGAARRPRAVIAGTPRARSFNLTGSYQSGNPPVLQLEEALCLTGEHAAHMIMYSR